MKIWEKLVIITAIFGCTLGYAPLYLFHVFAFLWAGLEVVKVVSGYKIVIHQMRLLYPIFILVIYAVITALWHPDIKVWFRYLFYLGCGLLALLAMYQSANDRQQLNSIFKIVGIFISLNLVTGLLESIGIIRLPMSPYGSFSHLFGIPEHEFMVGDEAFKRLRPTGFNFNPNTFGFVLMLSLPFFILHNNKAVCYVGFALSIWLLIAIGSRGLFLSFLVLLILLPFYRQYISKFRTLIMIVGVGTILFLVVWLKEYELAGLERLRGVFISIQDSFSLMYSNDLNNATSSIEIRVRNYLFGIQALVQSYGLGLGFGGIEARMIQEGFSISTFHFFFLQMLVDLGVIGFLFFIGSYLYLILKLRIISKESEDAQLAYFAQASSLSLFITIPASIAPSVLHYNLTYYLLIGFALLVLKIHKMELAK